MPKIDKLSEFRLEETEDGYILTVSPEGGKGVTVEITPEQMDAIIESLDDMLSEDEAALDEVEED
jgi:hypothetical protein